MKSNLKLNKYYSIFSYSILLIFLRIDLAFLNTLPTGGDMGAHVVPAKFFIDNLISNFKLSGWSSDWFAGYPAFYFYFPFPPLLVSLLSVFLPFNISFKLMVIIALVLLVGSIDVLVSKQKNSSSFIGFVAGATFLLTESFTIFGGNLASTLAGQYSFTFSMAFGNLAIYFIYKSQNKNRLILGSFMISACLLSHIIPFIFYSVFYFAYFLVAKDSIKTKFISVLLFLTLTIRFLTSLLMNLEFTTNMTYSPYTKLSDLIKPDILPFLLIVFVFLMSNKKFFFYLKKFKFETYLIFLSSILFFYGPEGALWNGRLVPFFNLGLILMFFKLLNYFINEIQNKEISNYLLSKLPLLASAIMLFLYYENWQERYFVTSIFICCLFLVMMFLNLSNFNLIITLTTLILIFSSITFLPHWLNWNFTGYESKDNWSHISKLYDKLDELEPGRIMWEPNSDMNQYGTPMVLMTIPLFTDHESVEGLYFDSSITTPFHFVTVSGLAESPSNPVGGLRYINGDFVKGVKFMQDLGVDYFISYTDSIEDKAFESNDLEYLFESEPFTVFKLKSNKIAPISSKLLEFNSVSTIQGIEGSVLRNRSDNTFAQLSMSEFINNLDYKYIEGLDKSDFDKFTSAEEINVENLVIKNSKITFTTDSPNQLHLIKVSYFPNWKITNGSGPYRVSPSFMAVIPYEEEVVLEFKNTYFENIINWFSLLFGLSAFYLYFYRNEKELKNV